MDYLSELEHESIFVLREAYSRFPRIALLWSMGKDSTVLLWMCRKAFLGRVPFPVVHIDTSYEFDEIYAYRARLAEEWGLDLVVRRNEAALAAGMGRHSADMLTCCHALKTEALRSAIHDLGLDAVLVGIRRDEHGIRAKERYFSPRESGSEWNYRSQPPELWELYASERDDADHTRIHPLLHMTELDIWHYVEREQIPVSELYFARDAKRFRSIGCRTCCQAVDSAASSVAEILHEIQLPAASAERAGRMHDQESAYLMQKLRSLGYM
jgi:sulfate adenylyltransferase subunit 2